MTLQEMVAASHNIVFFGGAGVSTESGIPDFRSTDGLYSQTYAHPPEIMLSHSFFAAHTDEFFAFYRDKLLHPGAKPNAAHLALAQLEQQGKLSAVITQNIDGLHTAAHSKNVLELHGSVLRNYCIRCGKFYGLSAILGGSGVPLCGCGGVIKPDVVLYEEPLRADLLEKAAAAIAGCDCLIVGGTSLAVYPAAGLIDHYQGTRLVLINKTQTPYDSRADLIIRGSIGRVLAEVCDEPV